MKIYSSNLYQNNAEFAEFGFGKSLLKNKGMIGKVSRNGLRQVNKVKKLGLGAKAKSLGRSGLRKANRLSIGTLGKKNTMGIRKGIRKGIKKVGAGLGRAKAFGSSVNRR